MKKQWVSPEAKVQEFVANEYVAACATLKCNAKGRIFDTNGNSVHISPCDPCPETKTFRESELQRGICEPDETFSINNDGDEYEVFYWMNGYMNMHASNVNTVEYTNAS